MRNIDYNHDYNMDLFGQTKKLCRQYNIEPSRSKGQNFLITGDVYDEILEAADLRADDTVMEVGPGFGFLTARLAKKAKKLIAVELDDRLAGILRERMAEQGIRNVEVINEDILKFSIFNFQFSNNFQFPISNFKIVANLPYNITSIFLRKFLSAENKPQSMTLMLQKEVAERICAHPPKMSLLAVSVQFYAEPKINGLVPADDFWPRPEVDSAIVHLAIREKKELNSLGAKELSSFFRLVKAGFSSKRKMLKNNLAAFWRIEGKKVEEKLKMAGFGEKIRAQELTVADWLELFEIFGQNML